MKDEISARDLANLIIKIMGANSKLKSKEERTRPINSEVDRLFCDNSKLKDNISWSPQYFLKEGISKVVEWMKRPENKITLKAIDIVYKIPLSAPSLNGNELKYVKERIDTEWVSSAGAYVDLFEQKICEYTGSKYAIACVNGTASYSSCS